jgi:Uma2 family endonuclease
MTLVAEPEVQETPQAFTPEDLLTRPGMELFELVDGHPVEKNMGAESAWIELQLSGRLNSYVNEAGLGWAFPADTGFQCFPHAPRLVRKPDIAFVRRDRLPVPPRGHVKIAPDLAVEVVSPNDLFGEVLLKVEEYRRAGVPLVWVIDPDSRTIHVYREGAAEATVLRSDDDELSGEDVVPGFVCGVGDLFPAREEVADQ